MSQKGVVIVVVLDSVTLVQNRVGFKGRAPLDESDY
jgi:hypothetical protein